MNFFLTGASGFVGKNFIEFFQKEHEIKIYNRGSKIDINEDVVIHFAGKAHDTKNLSNSNEYYNSNTELRKKIFDSFKIKV